MNFYIFLFALKIVYFSQSSEEPIQERYSLNMMKECVSINIYL